MRALFACMGTAGHINPALAVAAEMKERDSDAAILFVGAGKRMERRLIPAAGFRLVNIRSNGFARGRTLASAVKNISSLKDLVAAHFAVDRILNDFSPDIVIGTGGYVCYPVLKRAAAKGIPTLIHESNAQPGLTTKMLSGVVTHILTTFPDTAGVYRNPEKIIVTGTPLRSGFTSCGGAAYSAPILHNTSPLVLSFFGSLGAEKLNAMLPDFIERAISERAFALIHATGTKEEQRKLIADREMPDNIDIREYIEDMPKLLCRADLVICRAGASTIAELAYAGKPAIIIPSPYVTDNHQEKNAEAAAQAGGAIMLRESECTGEVLYNAARSLLGDEQRLRLMSQAWEKLRYENAAEIIADLAQKLVRDKNTGKGAGR